MSQKQSASACTCILVVFILKWEKKTILHLEIISFIYIYLKLRKRKTPKGWNEMQAKPCIELWDEDEWDENETLHSIMMMVKKL